MCTKNKKQIKSSIKQRFDTATQKKNIAITRQKNDTKEKTTPPLPTTKDKQEKKCPKNFHYSPSKDKSATQQKTKKTKFENKNKTKKKQHLASTHSLNKQKTSKIA